MLPTPVYGDNRQANTLAVEDIITSGTRYKHWLVSYWDMNQLIMMRLTRALQCQSIML